MSKTGSGPPPLPPDLPLAPTPSPTDEGEALSVDSSTAALSDSGADQLLSSAVPDGLSNPYDSPQGGWAVGSQEVDPNTRAVSGRVESVGVPNALKM